MEPIFFATPDELRRWFEENHDKVQEQWIGFYKKGSGKPSITWEELVDQELCFGWIDGIRKSIDDISYTNRITPRKPNSIWSAKNIASMERLTQLDLMHPRGLEAFNKRKAEKSAIYSFEQTEAPTLSDDEEAQFRADKAAWAFFEIKSNSYKRSALHWVTSAKKPETRQKRLTTLIEDSANSRTLKQFTPIKRSK